MQVENVLGLLRRWWWLLVVVTAASAALGYYLASQQAPSFEARTRLLVGPFHGDLNTQRAAGQLTLTYAELVRSQTVVQATVEQLSLGVSSARLAESIRTSANSATRILTVSLDSGDPARAAAIVNTLAENLIRFATSASASPEGQVSVIDPAQPVDVPVAPRPGLVSLVAGSASLVAALLFAALFEYLDNGVRSARQLARIRSAPPVLVTLRPRRGWLGLLRTSAVVVDPLSRAGLQLELLGAKMEFSLGPDATARRMVLLPIDPRRGAEWVAINLAGALARRGRRVTVVDVHGAIDSGDGTPGPAIRRHDGHEIPAGVRIAQSAPDTTQHLTDERAEEVIDAVLVDSDVAVVHVPAAQLAPDSIIWARIADAVLLVVHAGDPAPAIRELGETLELVGARVVGAVFVDGAPLHGPARSLEERAPDRPLSQGWRDVE